MTGRQAALALLAKPALELGRIGEGEIAEHAATGAEVVPHGIGEAQRVGAGDPLATVLLQLKQALRSVFRAASGSLSGHSIAANRARGVGPSMARPCGPSPRVEPTRGGVGDGRHDFVARVGAAQPIMAA